MLNLKGFTDLCCRKTNRLNSAFINSDTPFVRDIFFFDLHKCATRAAVYNPQGSHGRTLPSYEGERDVVHALLEILERSLAHVRDVAPIVYLLLRWKHPPLEKYYGTYIERLTGRTEDRKTLRPMFLHVGIL